VRSSYLERRAQERAQEAQRLRGAVRHAVVSVLMSALVAALPALFPRLGHAWAVLVAKALFITAIAFIAFVIHRWHRSRTHHGDDHPRVTSLLT
jgi:hypothetical protein